MVAFLADLPSRSRSLLQSRLCYSTVLRPRLSVCTECIVARLCVIEQKLLLAAGRGSLQEGNRI